MARIGKPLTEEIRYVAFETRYVFVRYIVVAVAVLGRFDEPPVDGVRWHGRLPTRFRRDRRAFRTYRDRGFSSSAVVTTPKLCAGRGPDAHRPYGLAFTARKTAWCEQQQLHGVVTEPTIYRYPNTEQTTTPVPFQIEKIFRLLLKISVEGSTQRSLEN